MPPDRSLRAWLRDHGPAHPRIPWSTPDEARAALPRPARLHLGAFRRRLRDAWRAGRPHRVAAEALAELDPGSRVALYPGSPPGGPPWFVQSITSGVVSTDPLRHHEVLPEVRLYELEGLDPFADRPATLPTLVRHATRRENAIAFVERLLHPNDVHQQLRMVLYRGPRASLYAGWYRHRSQSAFDLEEHALLLAARPALRTWFAVTSAIGLRPLGDGALAATLTALDAPALLLRRGRVAFANDAGARLVEPVSRPT